MQISNKLIEAAELIWNARNLLLEVQASLSRSDDITIIKQMISDFAWANENCSVVAGHQVGKFTDDTMGV